MVFSEEGNRMVFCPGIGLLWSHDTEDAPGVRRVPASVIVSMMD